MTAIKPKHADKYICHTVTIINGYMSYMFVNCLLMYSETVILNIFKIKFITKHNILDIWYN